ncbi:hypothetical protein GCM10008090_10570 [Arenicella chitinivorans]|uniref:Uncharacterized protein n=1 Tax=Arenicella chitinivorans TaxID=1329800 RepID=A0A918RMU1_9GAMM|nr:hypothetical protein GCM10008090_10570 [Arenicella chitinivorans]
MNEIEAIEFLLDKLKATKADSEFFGCALTVVSCLGEPKYNSEAAFKEAEWLVIVLFRHCERSAATLNISANTYTRIYLKTCLVRLYLGAILTFNISYFHNRHGIRSGCTHGLLLYIYIYIEIQFI